MPLLLIVGFPASGKTTLVSALVDHLRMHRPDTKIVVVRDSDLTTFDRSIYNDSNKEKEHRGYLRSLAQNALDDQTLVIVDALNYIKGFRYELYCAAKLAKTCYCVTFCDVNEITARAFNDAKNDAKEKYAEDILQALVQRFEPPDSRNRWDSPLITATPTPDQPTVWPVEEIVECIFEGKRLTSNQSTQSQPLSSTNFLYELDCMTQNVVKALMEAQKTVLPGDHVTVPGTEQKVRVKAQRSLGELTRLRRQFITYAKSHPVDDTKKLASMFVTFINNS